MEHAQSVGSVTVNDIMQEAVGGDANVAGSFS